MSEDLPEFIAIVADVICGRSGMTGTACKGTHEPMRTVIEHHIYSAGFAFHTIYAYICGFVFILGLLDLIKKLTYKLNCIMRYADGVRF